MSRGKSSLDWLLARVVGIFHKRMLIAILLVTVSQLCEHLSSSADPSEWAALAVDMTARNFQDEVKKKGLPWSAVKGFDTFTPIRCDTICLVVSAADSRSRAVLSFPSRRSPTRII